MRNQRKLKLRELIAGGVAVMFFFGFSLVAIYAFMCNFGVAPKFDYSIARMLGALGASVGLVFTIAFPRQAFATARIFCSGL